MLSGELSLSLIGDLIPFAEKLAETVIVVHEHEDVNICEDDRIFE